MECHCTQCILSDVMSELPNISNQPRRLCWFDCLFVDSGKYLFSYIVVILCVEFPFKVFPSRLNKCHTLLSAKLSLFCLSQQVTHFLLSSFIRRRNLGLICCHSTLQVTCIICCFFHAVVQPHPLLGMGTVRIKS